MLGDQVDWVDPLMPWLAAWWPLSEGAGESAVDLSGHNNGADWNRTGTHWAGSSRGVVGQFNGAGDYLDVGDVPDFDFDIGEYSLAAWAKTTDRGTLMSKLSDGAPMDYTSWEFGIGVNATGKSELYLGGWKSSTSATYADGKWHHVVIAVGGNVSFFKDGIADGTAALSGINKNTIPVQIGARCNSGSSLARLSGLLSDVRIYNRALTPDQVKQLYLRTSY